MFLSGGQTPAEATLHLSLMNRLGSLPWQLSFSYGRALQDAALTAWGGKPANFAAGQKEFQKWSRLNGLARSGGFQGRYGAAGRVIDDDAVVTVRDVHYAIGAHVIFKGLNVQVRRGAITAVMGPSGTGKTTLLRLIMGQVRSPERHGTRVWHDVARLKRRELYQLRQRVGLLFQNGALLTDLSVFENVAFPLREHAHLPEPVLRELVLMKLQAVGLRGAADLTPAELSGGMARRVALARAIVMDPEVLIYDEPFVGLDPISMGVIVRLIQSLNRLLGITSIVVSHDVREIGAIANYSYLLSEGEVVAEGTPAELNAEQQGRGAPVHERYARWAGAVSLSGAATTSSSCSNARAHEDGRARGAACCIVAAMALDALAKIGAVTLFLLRLLGQCIPAWRARWLVVQQIYNAGARSLVIIMLSGLFVGMVLGLQGYDLLQRFGSESAVGVVAALGLIKELGPVLTALLFAGRAGTSLCSEIGLMAATDQLVGDGDDGGGPGAPCGRATISRRIHRGAAAGSDLQLHRHLRRAVDRCDHDGHPARHLLVTDAKRGASCAMSTKG